jgi:hypothetical protein
MRTARPRLRLRLLPMASTRGTYAIAGSRERLITSFSIARTPKDHILVTLNVGDFEALVRNRELHGGVVLVERTGLLRNEQVELVKQVAAAIAEHGDLINQVLRVAADGTMTFENLSASAST